MKKTHQSNEKPPIPKKPDAKLLSQRNLKAINKNLKSDNSSGPPPPPPPLPMYKEDSAFTDSNIKLKTRDSSGYVKDLSSSSSSSSVESKNKGLIDELVKRVKINDKADEEAEERARKFVRPEKKKELDYNSDVKKVHKQDIEIAKSADGIPIPPPMPPMTSITTDDVKKKHTQSMRLPDNKSKPLIREFEDKLRRRSKES